MAAVAAVWTVGAVSAEDPPPVAEPLVVSTAYVEGADTLRRNETLSHLFARQSISGSELVNVLAAAEGLNPRRVFPNQVFEFRYEYGSLKPDRIKLRLGSDKILTLSRDSSDAWSGISEAVVWSVELQRLEGVIESSVYETVDGIISDSVLRRAERHRLVEDLSDGVFGWVIDFYRDFYPGDRFTVLYERLTSDLGDVRYGRVVAAKVETRGRVRTAYVVTDTQGGNAYYDEEGRSLRRRFKIRPIALGLLTSRFSTRRFHPILKRYRPHLGIDYAAMTGAEVVVTGDGRVTRAGRWGTYGIVVVVKHDQAGIETRYGHLSRLAQGIRPGAQVKQGQVVGYVGMTGLATAPHVHYEILRSGRHIDPRTVRDMVEQQGAPVPARLREAFADAKALYGRLIQSGRSQAVSASPDP
jgi:murein DD-endopeptidase MepM/ murein hydrolase activator NlpD